MDVSFWTRSSASTSSTLHVNTSIDRHTFCLPPPSALTIDDGDDGLGWTHAGRELGQCQPLVRHRPVPGAHHRSVVMKAADQSPGRILSRQQIPSALLTSLTGGSH